MQDVNSKENCVHRSGDTWEFSTLSAQFSVNLKLFQNIKSIKKEKEKSELWLL